MSPADRGRLLSSFAATVDSHIDAVAQLEVRNSGHTIGNAAGEADNLREVPDLDSASTKRLSSAFGSATMTTPR